MSASIVRGRYVITKPLDLHHWDQVDDGAVLVADGTVQAIGSYQNLKDSKPDAQVIGNGRQVLLRGFVNVHHHIASNRSNSACPTCRLSFGSSPGWSAVRSISI